MKGGGLKVGDAKRDDADRGDDVCFPSTSFISHLHLPCDEHACLLPILVLLIACVRACVWMIGARTETFLDLVTAPLTCVCTSP
jgi:hypothetical protein